MPNKDELTKSLQSSNWKPELKTKVQELLPKLERNGAAFLQLELEDLDSYLSAEQTVRSIEAVLAAIDQAEAGSFGALGDLIAGSPGRADMEFGRVMLPFVLDIEERHVRLAKNLSDLLHKFKAKVFRLLPYADLLGIVRKDLLYYAARLNLPMEFKRALYYANANNTFAWGKQLADSLALSDELLGKNNIVIDGKPYPPTIKQWIAEYIAAIPKKVAGRTAFDEIQYMKRSPNVSKLDAGQQQMLTDVIKLYNWFLNPKVTRSEVEEYEQWLEDQQDSAEEAPAAAPAAIARPVEPPVARPRPATDMVKPGPGLRLAPQAAAAVQAAVSPGPSVPLAKPVTAEVLKKSMEVRKELEQQQRLRKRRQEIDEKLEALKKKVA